MEPDPTVTMNRAVRRWRRLPRCMACCSAKLDDDDNDDDCWLLLSEDADGDEDGDVIR